MNIHSKRDWSLDPPSNYRHDAMPGDYDDDAPLELWDKEPRWRQFSLLICLTSVSVVGYGIWCVVDWVW